MVLPGKLNLLTQITKCRRQFSITFPDVFLSCPFCMVFHHHYVDFDCIFELRYLQSGGHKVSPKWCESAQPQTQNQHISINVSLSRCCRICIVSHHSKERSLRYKDFLNGHRQWPRYFLIWNWQFLLTHFKNGLCTHNRYKTLCDLALVLLVQLNFDIQANYQFR